MRICSLVLSANFDESVERVSVAQPTKPAAASDRSGRIPTGKGIPDLEFSASSAGTEPEPDSTGNAEQEESGAMIIKCVSCKMLAECRKALFDNWQLALTKSIFDLSCVRIFLGCVLAVVLCV